MQGLVFEPLVQQAGDGTWRPRVLGDLQRVTSGQYRLRLGQGVTFSDGSPLRAQDVATAVHSGGPLEEHDGWLIARIQDGGAQTEAELLAAAVWRQSASGPLGTGPFVVEAQDPTHILLRRRARVSQRINEVELVAFPTPRDAFAAALRGEVNMLLMPDDGELELLSGVETLRVIRGHGVHSVALMFNTSRLAAADRKRLGLALPLDQVGRAFGSSCSRQGAARPTLQLPPGPPIDLVVAATEPGLVRAALALRRALGARAGAVSIVTPEEARRRAAGGDFGALLGTLQTSPADLASASWLTGSPRNLTGYSNLRVDAAIRVLDYALAQTEMVDDPPALIICRLDRTAVVDSRVVDARLGDYDMLDSLDAWQIAP